MRLWNWINASMLANGGQVFCEQKSQLKYEDVRVLAMTFAERLRGEKCCAILCASEMMTAISLLACFAADVTAVPMAARYGGTHYKKLLDFINPTALLTDMSGELQIVRLSEKEYVMPKERPALILCTSGTTGMPKGVMLSESNLISNVIDICSYFDIDSTDRILISRPLFHSSAVTGEFLVSLIKGCYIFFYSEEFNPRNILDTFQREKITVYGSTPTVMRVLSHFNKRVKYDGLRVIAISGECMSGEVGLDIASGFPKSKIYHVYGLTEAAPRVLYLPPEDFANYPYSVGRPLDSVTVKVVKEDGQNAGIGESGILWVKGPNVMMGYYKDPIQTKAVLQDGWLCTGDVVFITANGYYSIKGRADDLIIRAGMNIYPQEIEGALKLDSRVKDVVAYGYSGPNGIMIGIDISGEFKAINEVRALCRQVLPEFQIPTTINIVKELPKTASGKVQRRRVMNGGT